MPTVARYSAGKRDTIVHALDRAVASAGEALFLNVEGETFTYREVDRLATRLGHALRALGVGKGDRVVTLCDTSADIVPLWLGINKIGAVWVPINTAYRHQFLLHQVNDADSALMICDAHYLERFVEIADQITGGRRILCRGQGPFPACAIPIEAFDAHRGTDETPIPINVTPQDLACLIYTSGTTGPSKGCMISHNYLCSQARQHRRAVPQERHEIGWTCLPMFHTGGITHVLGAMVGALPCAIWPAFSLSHFWDHIEASGASHALLMATIFTLVANGPETPAMQRCHGQLKAIYGVPIPTEIGRIWQERFGIESWSGNAYGQTEANRISMVAVAHGEPAPVPGSAGRPSDEFEVMIFDDDDQPVPDGVVGEIVVRPRQPNVMFDGYWRRPAETAAAWRNLWMHTGDLGRMEDGCLFFVDRKKDYLRSRGENISSFEVERTFQAHPMIRESAVHAIGVQDGEDAIKLTVILREEGAITERALCEWAIDRLPHFAVPRYIEFRAELPRNPTGRILKYRLRDEGVTSTTWDREAAGIYVKRARIPAG